MSRDVGRVKEVENKSEKRKSVLVCLFGTVIFEDDDRREMTRNGSGGVCSRMCISVS